jgi:hypothetical protein
MDMVRNYTVNVISTEESATIGVSTADCVVNFSLDLVPLSFAGLLNFVTFSQSASSSFFFPFP